MTCKYSYLGTGSIYAREAGTNGPLRAIGNVSQLEISISEETFELKNYQSSAGGLCASVRRIDKASLAMSMHGFSPENLALAVFGDTGSEISSTITDEAHTAGTGLIRTLKAIDATQPVVVTDSTGTTTYVVGDDYEVKSSGIYIPDTSAIPDASSILVDYVSKGMDVVEAITRSGVTLELTFDGLNGAESKEVILDAYRVQFGPTSGLGLIGDDFGVIEVSGDMLADDSKPAGESQYFRWQYAA